MNTILSLVGAVAAFWIANELVIKWGQPLIGFGVFVLFVLLALGAYIETSRELSEPIQSIKNRIAGMRRRR